MIDESRQKIQQTPEPDFPEFGVVRVVSRPAPDAEDRLRRLFTILLGQSAVENRAESEKDSHSDDRRVGNHLEEAET